MKTEAKKNLLAASLYIALAVMIVTVVAVTVISIAKKAKDIVPSEPATTQITDDKDKATEPITRPTAPTEQTDPTSGTKPTKAPNSDKDTVTPPESDNSQQVDEPVDDKIPESFSVPANGYISKGYEPDLPVWSTTMEDYRIHDGIDVLCDSDAEVYACADGTIESVYEDPLMGYAVTVYHGGGLRSTYMGLTGDYPGGITPGGKVVEGQVMAWVGDTALIECAEPMHLHFVMTLDEETVDPQDYITFESATMNEYE